MPPRLRFSGSWTIAGAWLAVQLVVPAIQLAHRPAKFGWHMFADLRDFPVLVGVVGARGHAGAGVPAQNARRDTLDATKFVAARRGDLGPDFDRRLVAHICAHRPEYAAIEERDPAHAGGPPIRVTACQ